VQTSKVRKVDITGVLRMFFVERLVLGAVRTNCYFLSNDKKEVVIIDPADRADIIINFIAEKGLKPLAILLTHGHFDHIGAADELRREYDIKVYAHKDEKDVLNMQDYNLSASFDMDISIDADVYLADGQVFELGGFTFKTVHTPGHTKGSVCYVIGDMIFSGDTLFEGTHGRTDFPTGSQSAMVRSIKEKLLVLDENMKVYPGHNMETTIGEEKRYY